MENKVLFVKKQIAKHLENNYQTNKKAGFNSTYGCGSNSGCGCSNNYLFERRLLKKTFEKTKIIKIREFDNNDNPVVFEWIRGWNNKWMLNKHVFNKNDVVYVGGWHHILNKRNNEWINVCFGVVK